MKGFSDAAATIFLLFLSLGVAGGLYALTTSFFAAKPIIIEEVTGYCVNNTAYFVIRNGGNTPLTRASFVCTKISSSCGECVVDEIFPPGGAGYVKVYDCPIGTHRFRLSVSSNSLPLDIYCK